MKYLKNLIQANSKVSADFYVYGALVDEKQADFWTGETSKTEVDPLSFKEELENIEGLTDLNIYINSGGGSVFASSSIVSMLQRFKQNGIEIHAFIDGLCASASTYLCMVANDVNIYKNSILMIHKPMTMSFGNANDLQKDIDTLNTIQNGMMLPLYMEKAKVTEEEINSMVDAETWLDSNEIVRCFEVNLLDEEKAVENCYSKRLFMNYTNVPESLLANNDKKKQKNKTSKSKKPKQPQVVDFSKYENRIKLLKLKKGVS